jgi:hypothetical protein
MEAAQRQKTAAIENNIDLIKKRRMSLIVGTS